MISWFTKNSVAANLLMISIIILGIFTMYKRTILEVFPEIQRDIINIQMSYRGATPVEVEEGVVIKIEEAIFDLVGIDEISSTASEGSGQVRVEVDDGYDVRELLDDIKNRVDGINTFPVETERPSFSISQRRREVISLVLHGDVSEMKLREMADQIRDDLTMEKDITQVDIVEIRPFEISIEISEENLQKYNLSFREVARKIQQSSLDLPAGALKTSGGEILLRSKGQAYKAKDFAEINIITGNDGRQVKLRDIATIEDAFEEEPIAPTFDGRSCVVLDVYRVGDQNPMAIAKQVKDYIAKNKDKMPQGLKMDYWRDRSVIIEKRLSTLFMNAAQGAVLVLIILTLFLRPVVAFWVTIGIPVSFLGALACLPTLGVTVNIVSLFGFILVLGIVVDDAIVTGENVYAHNKRGDDPLRAAIDGTKEVALPVTFGILTTIAAFMPMVFMGGQRGPIFAQIALVVIPVLIFSLVESKLVLPAHLKHMKIRKDNDKMNFIFRLQNKVSQALEGFIKRLYTPVLAFTLKWRYASFMVFFGMFILTLTYVKTGRMLFTFFPKVQSETATGSLAMPLGTPYEVTEKHIARMRDTAKILQDKYRNKETGESIIKHILATPGSAGRTSGQSHIGRVRFEIIPPEDRVGTDITSMDLVKEWRKLIGPIPGARELSFRAEIGRSRDPIDVQLAGANVEKLQEIAVDVKAKLREFQGVFDIIDSSEDGKDEIQLRIKPEAELLGLTMQDLAQQVRQGFFGVQVQRIQRGRDDVRVMARYPLSERRSLGNLEQMKIRTPDGTEVPFSEVAIAEYGKGFASIQRVNRRRTINITADVNKEEANMQAITADLKTFMDDLVQDQRGVSYSFEGEMREQRESQGSLGVGILVVLFVIYGLLAIPFKSYTQPLIVMSVIPFGFVCAVYGHALLGMSLSIFSIFGMLALTGVVVNDSLVLVDYINQRVRAGMTLKEAVTMSGAARFRPILLTSLTTFAGLTPLIFDQSTQAQFLIPMAVSLGFGVLFTTFVTLLLIPVNYLVLEDIKKFAHLVWHLRWPTAEEAAENYAAAQND